MVEVEGLVLFLKVDYVCVHKQNQTISSPKLRYIKFHSENFTPEFTKLLKRGNNHSSCFQL